MLAPKVNASGMCLCEGLLGFDSLSEFSFLAAIINEAMRMYRPFTVILREALQETQVIVLSCCCVPLLIMSVQFICSRLRFS